MIPGLETLIAAFGAGLGQYLPKEVIEKIYAAIANSQLRKVWRRSIRDLIEDEVTRALLEHKVSLDDAIKYVDKKEDYYKQEVRNRFDPALQSRD